MTKNEFNKQMDTLSNQAQILNSWINSSSLEEPRAKTTMDKTKKQIKVVLNQKKMESDINETFLRTANDGSPYHSSDGSPKLLEVSP